TLYLRARPPPTITLFTYTTLFRSARRTGKDVNSHTVLDGIITTIMATIQRINIIGSREGSRNRRRLKANQTGKKFRVGIKSNNSTTRNNLISGVDRCIHLNAMKKTTITSINRQDRKSGSAGMPRPTSYAVFCLKKKKTNEKRHEHQQLSKQRSRHPSHYSSTHRRLQPDIYR